MFIYLAFYTLFAAVFAGSFLLRVGVCSLLLNFDSANPDEEMLQAYIDDLDGFTRFIFFSEFSAISAYKRDNLPVLKRSKITHPSQIPNFDRFQLANTRFLYTGVYIAVVAFYAGSTTFLNGEAINIPDVPGIMGISLIAFYFLAKAWQMGNGLHKTKMSL